MKRIERIILTTLLATALVILTAFSAFAVSHNEDNVGGGIESEVVSQAVAWLEGNYKEFYYIRNVQADIARVFENDDEIRYTVAMSCETMLKVNSVDELPFVQGLNSALDDKHASRSERAAIDYYINNEIDANFGEYSDLSVDVVIFVSKNDDIAPWTMYFQDGMETTLYDIGELALDAQAMYDAGRSAASDIVEAYVDVANRGYSQYNRNAATAYAQGYSSNPTDCYDCGTSCGSRQDRTKWNNKEYKYFDVFKHTDCADFVSQAMSYGGLPESGEWYRKKNSDTLDKGSAWAGVTNLRNWMTHKDRKYWDSSTFALTNSGNIILTSDSHVVMVTYKDTITSKYTAHTWDRKNYVYSDNTAYTYYTIKTT